MECRRYQRVGGGGLVSIRTGRTYNDNELFALFITNQNTNKSPQKEITEPF